MISHLDLHQMVKYSIAGINGAAIWPWASNSSAFLKKNGKKANPAFCVRCSEFNKCLKWNSALHIPSNHDAKHKNELQNSYGSKHNFHTRKRGTTGFFRIRETEFQGKASPTSAVLPMISRFQIIYSS